LGEGWRVRETLGIKDLSSSQRKGLKRRRNRSCTSSVGVAARGNLGFGAKKYGGRAGGCGGKKETSNFTLRERRRHRPL